jgi:hypothetical protein
MASVSLGGAIAAGPVPWCVNVEEKTESNSDITV